LNTADERTDQEVVRSVLAGDPNQFEVLVRRYQRRLVGAIYRLVGDYDEALDLSQDIFIKVYGALDRYDESFRFSTWLFRIATNGAIDHLRKKKIRTVSLGRSDADGEEDAPDFDPASQDKNPEQMLRNRELGKRLEDEIAALPEDYRELITLRHSGELAYEEIAELKNMPLGTVKNKIFRARMILREKLASDLDPS